MANFNQCEFFSSRIMDYKKFIFAYKDLTGSKLEWDIESKKTAPKFARACNLTVPDVYTQNVKLSQLRIDKPCVLKPMKGNRSKGVFSILGDNRIFDIERKDHIVYEEMVNRCADLIKEGILNDLWMVEELVAKSSHYAPVDYKFYVFYGKAKLCLEIERHPTNKHCWYTRDGSVTRTGKYLETEFLGAGVPEGYFEIAEQVSLEIPAPFIRVDFMSDGNRLVFSEFTPRPSESRALNDVTNKELGDAFIEAQAKLFKDLFEEKKFDKFKSFYKGK